MNLNYPKYPHFDYADHAARGISLVLGPFCYCGMHLGRACLIVLGLPFALLSQFVKSGQEDDNV